MKNQITETIEKVLNVDEFPWGARLPAFNSRSNGFRLDVPLTELADIAYYTHYKLPAGTLGRWHCGTNLIVIGSRAPQVYYHELMHMYDAKSYDLSKKGTKQAKIDEIVAELGSAVLCKIFGVKCDYKSVLNYIGGEMHTSNLVKIRKALYAVIGRIAKAINLIIADYNKV